MEDFKHIKNNIYYLKSKTNIGVILEDNEVVLIDSGNDKEAGRKLRQSFDKNNVKVKCILNTHSNADHIGANAYLMNQYNCESYSLHREVAFSKYPDLESSLLYGGKPTKKMQNKFLMSKPCEMKEITDFKHDDIDYFEIKGHFLDMIAFKTKDNVYFLGDSLFPQETIEKYHLFYIYDIKEYLNTLDLLETINNDDNDNIFIPSHCELTTDLSDLININRKKVIEISSYIEDQCENINFDTLLKSVFDHYGLIIDLNQYLLVGSTIRNYLSYLIDADKVEISFDNNEVRYNKKNN